MVIYPGPRKANVLQSEMETDKFNKFMEQNICNVHVFKEKSGLEAGRRKYYWFKLTWNMFKGPLRILNDIREGQLLIFGGGLIL